MRIRKPSLTKASLSALLTIGAVLLSSPTAATASPSSSPAPQPNMGAYDWEHATVAPTKAQLQQGIDDVIARTPGARQIDATTVEMAPGLIMRLRNPVKEGAKQADSPITVQANCNIYYVCAYEDRQYGGEELAFTTCGREWNLGNYAYPGGGYWNDKISSITNQQSAGTTSYFYNHNGSNVWSKLVTVASSNYRSNLALDSREDGGSGSPNDMIDGVHVCGSVPSPWKPNYP